jgi:hypothetical protein
MNRSILAAAMFLGCLMASVPATAAGTHMIFEGGGGYGVSDLQATGPYWDVAWGYGGKFRGFPIRFYVVLDYTGASLTGEGTGYLHNVEEHALLAGPRLYLPVARNMRIFGQALVGGFWSEGDWTIHDVEHYRPRDDGTAGKFSVGFQARLSKHISVGMLYDRIIFWEKENDLSVSRFVGLPGAADTGNQNRFGGTVTIHF